MTTPFCGQLSGEYHLHTISAIMSGAEGWNDIETYGDSKIDWLRQHRPFANGIPRRHTVPRCQNSCRLI
ncbi:transposase family protein [Aeromonas caviae]|uniref:transposase family protein n=1 Tax=Aeromonas caviae TaxID=648 RepID=UPI0039A66EE7